jgi:hypothetical protein
MTHDTQKVMFFVLGTAFGVALELALMILARLVY